MLIRPIARDFKIIAFYLGRVFLVVAAAGMLPAGWALLGREWAPFSSFLLMIGFFAVLGTAMMRLGVGEQRLDWGHGMVVVAVTWLVVPAIGAIPFLLSGHFGGPLDAYFDAMSGLSTTGLALVQDLDHLAPSLNFWRHLLHFLGGQGIIIAVLVLFAGGGALTMYYGEGRDDQILPSVRSTARFIWSVAAAHLVFGVVALGLVAYLVLGFGFGRSLFHGLMIFFAGFDTGGFSPQSTSLGYYHSAVFELVTAVLMVAGALSFGVHFALWRGPRRSLLKNLETRTVLLTFGFTMTLVVLGLALTVAYTELTGLSRQGFFQALSAQTGTGFTTIPSSELARWGGLAFGGMAIAMALGGMASSTAGGVKALRNGLTLRSMGQEVRAILLPHGAMVDRSYFQFRERPLSPDLARSVMTVSLLYVALYIAGAGVGIAYGMPLQQALFESVSAGANVGLSVGLTEPSMPALLKLTYVVQMWLGRLEFVAVFALVGFVVSIVRGK
ncbi:MAG: TrkH family potassium uptake protein [Acidimicrobiia bacterium]|nr:MAG: TrkH family potassium uptake protein [Acidimicrobiia bacterium]